jgi:hypothetical protein
LKALQIDEKDNVATLTSDVFPGEEVEVLSPDGKVLLKSKAVEAVSFAHKIALVNIPVNGKVIKYGEVIGVASRPIKSGEWVHVHNVESATVPTSAFRKAH